MCAFDLPSDELRRKFLKTAREKGVLMLGSGERSIRFRPALIITRAEVDTGIERIREGLKAL